MSADYRTIAGPGENTLIIKKSRFITRLGRVTTEAQAQAFIAAVQKREYKANHNVPVYLLGDQDQIQRAQDAGEPAGTAGVPGLEVLKAMGLHDVVAVTTRYFGGIKLGAGGLIRAYANSVQDAVHAVGIVRRVAMRELTLPLPYHLLGPVQRWAEATGVTITDTDYQAQVTLTLVVEEAAVPATIAALRDLTLGQALPVIGEPVAREVPVAD
ncbi:YigZ family protein [Lacticaseibacillus parakribbianus]|uniref:YigZ family protein n=1 Tax=Lacticaseibacillus parakribbianus TaxID=2970927 RepID=UPI0021CB9959|nr:YigZ family protein [Lacticaseibacillus parakribbianus]